MIFPDLFRTEPDLITSDEDELDYEGERQSLPLAGSPPPPTVATQPPPPTPATPPTSPHRQQPAGGLLNSPTADALAAGASPLPPPQGQAAVANVTDQQADDRTLERACKNPKSYRILKRKEKVKTMRAIQRKSQAITAYLEAKTRALNAQFPPPQNNDDHEPML